MIALSIGRKPAAQLACGDVVAATDAYTLALVIGPLGPVHAAHRPGAVTYMIECAGGERTLAQWGQDDLVGIFSVDDFIDWEISLEIAARQFEEDNP